MKVLLSAYACEPDRGSEPEVGLLTMLAAASKHDVWVLTRKNNLPALQAYLVGDPRADRIQLVGCDLGPAWRRLKRLNPVALQMYYDAWQRQARQVAVDLHRRVGFHLVHHATFAAYWTRVGVAAVDRPLLWGPVGGGVRPPLLLLPVLGPRGTLFDAGRLVGSGLGRVVNSETKVSLTLVQNTATGARLGRIPTTVVPNAVAIDLAMPPTRRRRGYDIAVVSRLLPWKGGTLAVRAFAALRHPKARLVFYGSGPDAGRIESVARTLGVRNRIVLAGQLPRAEVLARVATAGVLLHPSLREEAGMAVAEALAMGTPVVCLDHGGPAELLRWWARQPATAVPVGSVGRTAERLAEAMETYLRRLPPVPTAATPPSPSYQDLILDAYDRAANAVVP